MKSKNIHQKIWVCVCKIIILHALPILGLIVINTKTHIQSFTTKRIFTLIMNKIFIQAEENGCKHNFNLLTPCKRMKNSVL